MRQAFGFSVVALLMAGLLFAYAQLGREVRVASAFQQQLAQAIDLAEPKRTAAVVLRDAEGRVFSNDFVEWRKPLPLERVPRFVQNLYIESEDAGFYNHFGLDAGAIVRAMRANSAAGANRQGASTITQQLVRMRYLSEQKSYERKVSEVLYSYEMEKRDSKRTILENYLNEMYYGHQVYGIGAASSYYFSRPLAKLTKGEMAFLCAIPNNPSLYDPLRHFARVKARQERLIGTMQAKGHLTAARAKAIRAEPIRLRLNAKTQLYPDYSTYVYTELRWLVSQREGYDRKLAAARTKSDRARILAALQKRLRSLAASGLVIDTALQPAKQARDAASADRRLALPGLQAGGVVIDNRSREIVSIYGGARYRKFDFQHAVQGVRQPGSVLKPLLIYSPLFETTSLQERSLVSGARYCIGAYCPQNYANATYGYVTVEKAFAFSLNTPALRLLAKVGRETAFSYLKPFQFRSITAKDQSYAAALGGFEYGVTPLEVADAYSSYVDGAYKPARAIRAVRGANGRLLYTWNEKQKRLWNPRTVGKIRGLLADTARYGTARGVRAPGRYVGAKTGTTNDFRDFWIAGLSDRYTAAVWVGYDRPRNMQAIESRRYHHQLFQIFLQPPPQ